MSTPGRILSQAADLADAEVQLIGYLESLRLLRRFRHFDLHVFKPATGRALSDWKALAALPTQIKWPTTAPQKMDLTGSGTSITGTIIWRSRAA